MTDTTKVPASLQALVKQVKQEDETPEQIQARLEAEKAASQAGSDKPAQKIEEQAQVKNTVRFAAFRSSMRTFTIHLGSGDVVHFFNHEAYIPDNARNKTILEKLRKIVDNEPEMGIEVSPYGEYVDVDPIEMHKQRKQAELNLFLSDRARRMAPVVSKQEPFNPSGSDASPLTKGDNSGSTRFTNVDIAAAKAGNK